ncbi:MAG TPA: metallophosphoesterase family protein [Thermoguttaceae bacterium]|nr:metallophosphoesterase family protein [Thermoguttaceae bacterium]
MSGRVIAIGDIHGCLPALETLVKLISPRKEDTIVTLGDYVDRGMQVRECFDLLMDLADQCRLVPILGNHDEMLLGLLEDSQALLDWLGYGGTTTLYSFGVKRPEEIPEKYIRFLRGCLPYYETKEHFFVHANYLADFPLEAQPAEALRWEYLRDRQPGPHISGKKAIVGHTTQKTGRILDLGYLLCIDTCCYGSGYLTAMDVATGQIWQADKTGRLKPPEP